MYLKLRIRNVNDITNLVACGESEMINYAYLK